MHAVVVYESMYGNTRAIASAVAAGLAETMNVDVRAVGDARDLGDARLIVLGAPTHAWGLSRASTRRAAAQAAGKPGSALSLEPGAGGPGMRDWLAHMSATPARVAVFDTHQRAPLGLHGSAGKRIAHRLRRDGHTIVGAPEGFIVSKQNRLLDGELDRARGWGRRLATTFAGTPRG
jgi:flavodoxin